MIGRPLMVMPLPIAASRGPVTGSPLLLGPSPEISMTRRKPRYGFSSNNGIAKLMAPEIEVREARRIGDVMGGFRAIDHPPGNDDLLVGRCRPFEICHRNLAVRQALQRLQKFLRDD